MTIITTPSLQLLSNQALSCSWSGRSPLEAPRSRHDLAKIRPGISPGLAELLRKFPDLDRRYGRLDAKAQTLEEAIARGDQAAIGRERQVSVARSAADAALQAVEDLYDKIVRFPSRNAVDVLTKLDIVLHEEGAEEGAPATCAHADLERLVAGGRL